MSTENNGLSGSLIVFFRISNMQYLVYLELFSIIFKDLN